MSADPDEGRHNNTNDLPKKYRIGTVSKNILLEGLNQFQVLCVVEEPLSKMLNTIFLNDPYILTNETTFLLIYIDCKLMMLVLLY